MHLNQACTKFVSGYFSTNERTKKTQAAYRTDLTQFYVFAGEELLLKSVSGALIERWCAHLRQRGYSPTSNEQPAALSVSGRQAVPLRRALSKVTLSNGLRYGVAVLSVALALIVRPLLHPRLDAYAPLLLFTLSVMVSAWHGATVPACSQP